MRDAPGCEFISKHDNLTVTRQKWRRNMWLRELHRGEQAQREAERALAEAKHRADQELATLSGAKNRIGDDLAVAKNQIDRLERRIRVLARDPNPMFP